LREKLSLKASATAPLGSPFANTLRSPSLKKAISSDAIHTDLAFGIWNGVAFSSLLWAAAILILL
jgi:hypothetical protein